MWRTIKPIVDIAFVIAIFLIGVGIGYHIRLVQVKLNPILKYQWIGEENARRFDKNDDKRNARQLKGRRPHPNSGRRIPTGYGDSLRVQPKR